MWVVTMNKYKFNFSVSGNISIKGDGTISSPSLELANNKIKQGLAKQFKVDIENINLTRLTQIK